jgi:CRP/FNR family transcriptional regulator
LSRELALRETVIAMLGTPSADARVAHFLMSLSDRLAAMGYSSKAFNLRMTRQEIGNYLSLTLESVSRSLSAFAESGWITVHHRSISIDNAQALRRLSRPHVPARPARTRQPLE